MHHELGFLTKPGTAVGRPEGRGLDQRVHRWGRGLEGVRTGEEVLLASEPYVVGRAGAISGRLFYN